MKSKIAILCLLVVIINSCAVQKRHYQSGYNIVWNKNKEIIKKQESINSKAIDSSYIVRYNKADTENLIASKDDIFSDILIKKSRIISFKNKAKENCDNIVLKSGEEIKGKVLEITQTEIKYKSCDNLDGPLITIDKSSVLFIKYFNGTKEIYNNREEKNKTQEKIANNNPPSKKHVHPLSVLSFIFSLISLPITWYVIAIGGIALALLAVIFAFVGGGITRKNKEKWHGQAFAVLGLIFGIISLAVGILLLAVILA